MLIHMTVDSCVYRNLFNLLRLISFLISISISRYLDSSLIDVDVQPLYCRVTVKAKVSNVIGQEMTRVK